MSSSSPVSNGAKASRRPLVSVVMPTLDRPRYLDAALGSVAGQDLPSETEVIVVNDGGQSVAAVVDGWSAAGLRCRLIELEERVGVGAARNVGIGLSAGKYIAFLDDDDLFLPGHLTAACEPLERDVADFVYLGAVVASRRLGTCPSDFAGFRVKAYPFDYRFLQVANFVHTGSVVIRNFRDTPVRFDPCLEVCEDWDLWLSLINDLGYRVSFVDKVTCVYHQIPGSPGLVADGESTVPSRFTVAREYIHEKWPSGDPAVVDGRRWILALDRVRSDAVAGNQPAPALLFDEVLRYVHQRIIRGEQLDYGDLDRFFRW